MFPILNKQHSGDPNDFYGSISLSTFAENIRESVIYKYCHQPFTPIHTSLLHSLSSPTPSLSFRPSCHGAVISCLQGCTWLLGGPTAYHPVSKGSPVYFCKHNLHHGMCLPEPTQGCSITPSLKHRLVMLHLFTSQPHGIYPFPHSPCSSPSGFHSVASLSQLLSQILHTWPCPLSKMVSVANTCAWWLVSVFYLRLSCPQKACLLTYLWSKSSHATACDDHPSGLLGSVWVDSGILKVVDCTLIPQIHKYIKGRGRNPAQPLEMLLLGCLTISRCWINVC